MTATQVIFVNRPAHGSTGAKRMRVDQLAALLTPRLDGEFSFQTMRTPPRDRPRLARQSARQVEGAILIFHKRVWRSLTPQTQTLWRERARAIVIDWIDAEVTDVPLEVDLHLAASEAGRAYLAGRFGQDRVALLDHHADPAIPRNPTRTRNGPLRVAYLGHPDNTILPDEIAGRVETPAYDGGPLLSEGLAELAQAQMHWAVRGAPPAADRTIFKPFTKGAIAAALGANIIIERDADDAVRFLGPDYPFLLSDTQPATLAAMLDTAESAFGTSLWQDALAVMAEVDRRLSPDAIAAQFRQIMAPFRT